MAKGDDSRARNAIDYRGESARQNLVNTSQNVLNPQAENFWGRFNRSADQAESDYGNIMGNYSSLYNSGMDPEGYSADDLAAIRSRNVSPVRGIYQRSLDELDRHKNLAGGYMPNYGAARAKMARESSQAVSDVNTKTNADIAELKHGDLQERRQLQQQRRLAGAQGMGSLYGTTPGSANMFANNAQNAAQNILNWNSLDNSLEQGVMGNTINAGQLPGRFQSFTNSFMPWLNVGSNMLGGGLGAFGSNRGSNPGGNMNFNWGGWGYNS